MSQQIVALLPMKAHSERVKGKNFRSFAGKPLFRWMLDSLTSIDAISKVVINTDAMEILKDNGLESGGKVLIRQRRPEICGDFVSMNKIIADDIESVAADMYVMTHTTNPLLMPATLAAAIARFQKALDAGEADSLFTVNKTQTRFYRKDGSAVNHDPDNLIRTQDLEPWFEENSNLYLFTRESFAKTGARIGKRPLLFEMSRLESVDIDDQESWDLAELIAQKNLETGR